MTAALKSLTNNRATNFVYNIVANLYNDPASQLKNMMKYTSIFNKATLQPAGLVLSSLGFLYVAKKANTKKQKALAIITALSTGILGAYSIYTLINSPSSMANNLITKEECMRVVANAILKDL